MSARDCRYCERDWCDGDCSVADRIDGIGPRKTAAEHRADGKQAMMRDALLAWRAEIQAEPFPPGWEIVDRVVDRIDRILSLGVARGILADAENAPWWPPRQGDRLRHFTLQGDAATRVRQVHALVDVVAVFEHEGETLATIAEWWPTKQRWSYQTIHGRLEATTIYWPDGSPPPATHKPCDACRAAGSVDSPRTA